MTYSILEWKYMNAERTALHEGIGDFIAKHPIMSTVAAGYVLSKLGGTSKTYSSINVLSNILKFYAYSSVEIRLQKDLVKDLIATGKYRLVYDRREGDARVWAVRRINR